MGRQLGRNSPSFAWVAVTSAQLKMRVSHLLLFCVCVHARSLPGRLIRPSEAELQSSLSIPTSSQDVVPSTIVQGSSSRSLLSGCGATEADACVLGPSPNTVVGTYQLRSDSYYNVTACSEGYAFWILAKDASNYKVNIKMASSVLCTVSVFGSSFGRSGAVYLDLDMAAANVETMVTDSAPGFTSIRNGRLHVALDHVDDLTVRTKAASITSQTEQKIEFRLTGSSTMKLSPAQFQTVGEKINVTTSHSMLVDSSYTVITETTGPTTLQLQSAAQTSVSVACGLPGGMLPVWLIGYGEFLAAASTVNLTSGSSVVKVFSDGQLPNLAATGQGNALFTASFLGPTWNPSWVPTAVHTRDLTIENSAVPTLVISEQQQLSTVRWATDLDTHVAIDLYKGATKYTHSASAMDHLVLVTVKPEAYFEPILDVAQTAEVTANVLIVDQKYKVVMETGEGYIVPVPVDTATANISVNCGNAVTSTIPVWRLGKGDINAATYYVNMTSGSSHVYVHTNDRLPDMTATGQGDVLIHTSLLADQATDLTVNNPLPQLQVSAAKIGWASILNAHVSFDLYQGQTTYNHIASGMDNLVLVTMKPEALLEVKKPVAQTAVVDANVLLVDQAYRVVRETGGVTPIVPIDTYTANISVACPSGISLTTPLWTFHTGVRSAASSTVNISSATSHVFVHTTDKLPDISTTGQGDALINAVFLANRALCCRPHGIQDAGVNLNLVAASEEGLATFQNMQASAEAGTLVRALVKFNATKPPPFVANCPLEMDSDILGFREGMRKTACGLTGSTSRIWSDTIALCLA